MAENSSQHFTVVIKLKMGGSNPGGIGLIVMIVHVQNREVTLNFITCQYSKGDNIKVHEVKQYSCSSLDFGIAKKYYIQGVNHI